MNPNHNHEAPQDIGNKAFKIPKMKHFMIPKSKLPQTKNPQDTKMKHPQDTENCQNPENEIQHQHMKMPTNGTVIKHKPNARKILAK